LDLRLTKSGRDRLHAGLEERFAELAGYETEAGTAFGFLHVIGAAEMRAAVDARSQALRDLQDAVKDERARTYSGKGAAHAVSDAMLDRQEALAKAELVSAQVRQGDFQVSGAKAVGQDAALVGHVFGIDGDASRMNAGLHGCHVDRHTHNTLPAAKTHGQRRREVVETPVR
jgi:hypothetical protein